jgi:hypothetical protein
VLWGSPSGDVIVVQAATNAMSPSFIAVVAGNDLVRLPGSAGSWVYWPGNSGLAF